MIKKEARGLDDFSLGEVQSVGPDYIVTEKGTISKHKYFLPKYLVRGYDGHNLRFNVSESQAESEFKRDNPPTANEYMRYKSTSPTSVNYETVPSI
jgi:hypothetical protein